MSPVGTNWGEFGTQTSTGGGGGGSGTVTSVSVTSANGFAGTVATPTTTPAITISTTVTAAVLKGNGTAIVAAVAGTDYPATGVISAGGPTGNATTVPVITWNANGQLTAVTTATIAPTVLPSQYTTSTITADPAPASFGTYYRANYAGSGNFTLPSAGTPGRWIKVKQIANNTLSIVGTVDGNAAFTMVQFQSYTFIDNGTNYDIT